MTGIFKVLFNLKLNSNSQPLEDYLTEIFSYCLKNDQNIVNVFLKHFSIHSHEIEEYSISTQYKIKSLENHETDSRPDMVVFSSDLTLFFENKINALEGKKQLSRYAEHLDTLNVSIDLGI